MEAESKYFICDSKYENVIAELSSRGWTQDGLSTENQSSAENKACDDGGAEIVGPGGEAVATTSVSQALTIPARCSFIWMNLSSIKFPAVFGRFVNHLRGSQHMSNKGYLTYHLRASGQADLLPPTWSSCFEDALQLIEMVFLHEVARCAATVGLRSIAEDLNTLKRVQVILSINSKWTKTDTYIKSAEALAHLQRVSVDPHGEIAATAPRLDMADLLGAPPIDSDEGLGAENIWIIKPIGSSCGRNISVAHGWRALEIVSKDMGCKCVVQKYIERPLLVRRQQKFDIRQWVLITDVNPLVIYGFSQCYLRLSSQEYTLDRSLLSDPLVHLCNNSIQRRVGSEALEPESPTSAYIYHPLMMSQEEFADVLEVHRGDRVKYPNGVFVDVVKEQIKTIAINSLRSVREKLDRVGKGFEWLGFDLMVTESLKVKLIEINTSPDMTFSTPITEWLVKKATSKLMDLILNEKSREMVDKSTKDKQADWELWYYGKNESRADLNKVSQAKVERCSRLSPDYRPSDVDLLDRVVAFTSVNNNTCPDEESEDEF